MEGATDKMESIDLDATPAAVIAAAVDLAETGARNGKNGNGLVGAGGHGFVPLVTVVGFHHAR